MLIPAQYKRQKLCAQHNNVVKKDQANNENRHQQWAYANHANKSKDEIAGGIVTVS